MREIWKPVVGYECYYEVSTKGQVRRITAIVVYKSGVTRKQLGGLLKPVAGTEGYPTVRLYIGGKGKTLKIHRLVATAFFGPAPDGMEVCHNDGDKQNAGVDNLRYDTRSANQMDRRRHGNSNAGERHGCAKLTWHDVIAIREMVGTRKSIADFFGVSPSTITMIKQRKRWVADGT